MFAYFRRKRRKKILSQEVEPHWFEIIEKNFPYYNSLSEANQQELIQGVQIFIAEKNFEGCGGLLMTDEIRVTIAVQACVLLLNRKTDFYPSLKTILVYPMPYVVLTRRQGKDGGIIEKEEVRLGESWDRGQVVLAWNAVKNGAANIHDGQNLVFHEFAHQLDNEDGQTDGAPELENHSAYLSWAKVLRADYSELVHRLERRQKTFIESYGATNPAEFFAVVTETFFEQPAKLKKKHPDLYKQFSEFYRQDPAKRYEDNL